MLFQLKYLQMCPLNTFVNSELSRGLKGPQQSGKFEGKFVFRAVKIQCKAAMEQYLLWKSSIHIL